MRFAWTVALAIVVAGCAELGRPTPAPVAWVVDVPEAIGENPIVERGDRGITLLPISPTGAEIGVDYAYRMPQCGIRSPIDVDGSFWDAADVPDNSSDHGFEAGTFRLTSPIRATFTAPSREVLQLERHRGSKEFGYCF